MPALDDIPYRFLSADAEKEFVIWLKSLPVDLHIKQELRFIWNRFTQVESKPDHFTNLESIS
jgi:hypothetical protein